MRNDDPCRTPPFLYAGLALFGVAAAWMVARKIGLRKRKIPSADVGPGHKVRGDAFSGSLPHIAGKLYRAAAVLSFSVLADSSLEHYRGCFFSPFMYTAPTVSALMTAENAAAAAGSPSAIFFQKGLCGFSVLVGIAGFFFHLFNVLKREGSLSFHNLFYGAPLGAPGALAMAGVFGLAAARLDEGNLRPTGFSKLFEGRLLAALSVFGLLGTMGEVLLLHFRGAFQDKMMYLPITIPPVAGAALTVAALRPVPTLMRPAKFALQATALLGIGGIGLHAYGIQRNMGGWYNWSQMILQGPPVPAPPGFTGVALAGLASVALLEEGR